MKENMNKDKRIGTGERKNYLHSYYIKTHPLSFRGVGYSKWPEYKQWNSMKRRCYNKSDKDYKYYGARGIKIYQPWIDNFWSFYIYKNTELGIKPEGYTLDRIDNNGNYEPGNLKWSSQKEQQNNKRKYNQFGNKNPNCKLSDDDVEKIKQLYNTKNYSYKELGKLFNTTSSNISLIVRGKSRNKNG